MTDNTPDANLPNNSDATWEELEKRDTYEMLMRRAIGGDKEAMASLSALVSSEKGPGQYSMEEDLRNSAFNQMVNPKTTEKTRNKIVMFFEKLFGS